MITSMVMARAAKSKPGWRHLLRVIPLSARLFRVLPVPSHSQQPQLDKYYFNRKMNVQGSLDRLSCFAAEIHSLKHRGHPLSFDYFTLQRIGLLFSLSFGGKLQSCVAARSRDCRLVNQLVRSETSVSPFAK